MLARMPIVAALLLLLISCGGGGGGGGSAPPPAPSGPSFAAESTLAAKCASPRSGIDPITGVPFPDKQGTLLDEQNWLASWTNDLYLWYSEVSYGIPANYSTALAYFNVLKTNATTASGKPKDRFHFTYPTATWEALSQSGVQAGYGAIWDIVSGTPPREVVIAYTEPNSPATAQTPPLARGTLVLNVDGVDINDNTQAGINTLNAGLSPATAGESHTFTFQDLSGTTRTISLLSANVVDTPVQSVGTIGATTVGYMLFNDHLATAEPALISAITTLKAANITDLVLDIRYNGGGIIEIASELAYMIAGPTATGSRTFELTQFNGKHTTTDPVTGQPIVPLPFLSTSQGFTTSPPAGTALPYLGLSRVFVLTGSDTCSASESVINGLRGINLQVIQIGSTTCGKPYGFYPQDNCGTTYFSIQFQGVNAMGFGDYPDGFTPANALSLAGASTPATLPGCSVLDDFTHALGDPAEARLSAALAYVGGASCPAPSGLAPPGSVRRLAAVEGHVFKPPSLTNRVLRRRADMR
jgi:carboxyl-terminal processing protease